MPQIDNFIQTKEYKRFCEFCKACHKERYIGLCYGAAGVGKSISARQFASWNTISDEIYQSNDKFKSSIDMQDVYTVIYTPDVANSPRATDNEISNLCFRFNCLKMRSLPKADKESTEFSYPVELIIIDEADRLQPKTLEQIRDIYDRRNIPIILIGMPGLEKRLTRFPQLYSRIGFAHHFKPLGAEEVSFIITHHCKELGIPIDMKDFTDNEAIAAIIRITQGNFRLLNRLIKQTLRIMQINNTSSITQEVVESARSCLVIGNVY